MFRVVTHIAADKAQGTPFDLIVLSHDERRLRRKLLTLQHGGEIMVDFPSPITLGDRDRLLIEDGRNVEIVAAEEPLLEIRAQDATHLARLAWHLGNRHLPAQLCAERILIRRDRIIRDMLAGLGAMLRDVDEPFTPEPGAYSHGDAGHALLVR